MATIYEHRSELLKQATVLKLNLPFTEKELKEVFRLAVLKDHPDRGGKTEDFINDKKAYDYLLPFVEGKEEKENFTYEGQRLSDLGKGLGDLVNSTDCPDCHALGYTVQVHEDLISFDEVCPNCEGKGYVMVKRLQRDLPGFGYYPYWPETCTRCQGRGGFGRHVLAHTIYHTCYTCKGAGQILVPNPALPKNRVPINVPNEDRRPKKKYCECGALIRGNKCWRCGK